MRGSDDWSVFAEEMEPSAKAIGISLFAKTVANVCLTLVSKVFRNCEQVENLV